MQTDREIALEQAFVAFMGEAIAMGLDVTSLVNGTTASLMVDAPNKMVGHPFVSNAIQALGDVHFLALTTSK